MKVYVVGEIADAALVAHPLQGLAAVAAVDGSLDLLDLVGVADDALAVNSSAAEDAVGTLVAFVVGVDYSLQVPHLVMVAVQPHLVADVCTFVSGFVVEMLEGVDDEGSLVAAVVADKH